MTKYVVKEAKVSEWFTTNVLKELESHGEVVDPAEIDFTCKEIQQKPSGPGSHALEPVHEHSHCPFIPKVQVAHLAIINMSCISHAALMYWKAPSTGGSMVAFVSKEDFASRILYHLISGYQCPLVYGVYGNGQSMQ